MNIPASFLVTCDVFINVVCNGGLVVGSTVYNECIISSGVRATLCQGRRKRILCPLLISERTAMEFQH